MTNRNAPTRWRLSALVDYVNQREVLTEVRGRWIPARPLGLDSLRSRFAIAWAVFTGAADAVFWDLSDD